jgi:hypothetical protein
MTTTNEATTIDNLQKENVRLQKALDEIGTEAASVLGAENIRDWGDGGRLGDVLIGIKDIVATVYLDRKIEKGEVQP